jgi:hypothetical protein
VERLENWLTAIGDPDYTKPPVRQRHARPCSAAVSALAAFEAWRRVTLHSKWFLFVSALSLRT